MNDIEIVFLKEAFKEFSDRNLIWTPDEETFRVVYKISGPPKPLEGDEPEPSDCAYLMHGGYVALYGADIEQFGFLKMCSAIEE